MAWTLTYLLPGYRSAAEDTITLDSDFCDHHGIDQARLDSPEQAAWAVALILGSDGQDDAQLLTIDRNGTADLEAP